MDMDDILANAAGLNDVLLDTDEEQYDVQANQVVQALRKVQLNDAAKVFEIIENLDPSITTIPYFYLLQAIIESQLSAQKTPSKPIPTVLLPEGKLWPDVTQALLTFDPVQVRYVGSSLIKILEVVYIGAGQSLNWVPAIQLLQNVILRLDPSSSTLSIAHHYLVNACVHARAYQEATTILDRPIYHIPSAESTKTLDKRLARCPCSVADSSLEYINPQTGLSGKITTRVFLEYYFLGALCYIGTRQWQKAQAFLEVVLSAPCQQAQNICSVLTIESYKKWLLLELILNGNARYAPKGFKGNQVRSAKTMAKPYECLVDAYRTRNLERLQAEIHEGADTWSSDMNVGLLQEVVSSLTKFEVIGLGKTFAALPVEEVTHALSATVDLEPQAILKYVQGLISSGELKAEIIPSSNGGLGTVRFNQTSGVEKSEEQISQELAAKGLELQILLKHVTDYDHQLEVSKDYLEWLQKAKKARDSDKKAGQGGGPKPMGFAPGPADLDEDMMDDYP